MHRKDWCWSWNSNTLATWCTEPTHLKRPWCWKRLKAGGEGDDRAWDGWVASLAQWTWVWASSGSWWWTGRPGVLQSMGCKESDTSERLNWTPNDSISKLLNTYCMTNIVLYIYTHTHTWYSGAQPFAELQFQRRVRKTIRWQQRRIISDCDSCYKADKAE